MKETIEAIITCLTALKCSIEKLRIKQRDFDKRLSKLEKYINHGEDNNKEL